MRAWVSGGEGTSQAEVVTCVLPNWKNVFSCSRKNEKVKVAGAKVKKITHQMCD